MPKCVECGREALRDEMFGPADELRCARCADRYRQIFVAPGYSQVKPRRPVVTLSICALAIAATVAKSMHEPFMQLLILNPVKIWEGELWRLLSAVFPHVNILHLAFNVYWTWRFGTVVETWMGSRRFAGFFVLVAVGSMAVEFLATASNAIGLSGVGYALFGLLFALRHDKEFAAVEMRPGVVQTFVIWFFLCIFLTYTHIMPVANVAHGAGAVLGWLVGQAVLLRQRVWAVSGIVLLVLALCGATLYMPWNGSYAWFRGAQAYNRGELVNALYWFQQAERAFPNNAQVRAIIADVKREIDKTERR
jgi:membrane associated rhomboid family serine protease